MSAQENGGPAFPVSTRAEDFDGGYGHQDGATTYQFGGMSLRQYAAIHLRVPMSGTDWLDEMIRKAQWDHCAALAMQTEIVVAGSGKEAADELLVAAEQEGRTLEEQIAFNAYSASAAMAVERLK